MFQSPNYSVSQSVRKLDSQLESHSSLKHFHPQGVNLAHKNNAEEDVNQTSAVNISLEKIISWFADRITTSRKMERSRNWEGCRRMAKDGTELKFIG